MISLTFWLALANLIQVGLSVGRVSILTRWLGVEMMGQFGYALALVAIADMVAQAGLNTVLTRDVAAQPKRDGALFGAVLGVRVALSIVAGAVVGALAGPWVGVMVLSYVGQIGVAVLRGKLLRGPQIAANLLPAVLSTGAVTFMAFSRVPSAQLAVGALALSILLAAGGQLFLAAGRLNHAFSFSSRLAIRMLKVSWPFWLAGLTVIVLYRLDVIMLKWLLPAGEGERAIGLYWPATKLVETGLFMLGALVTVAMPAMASISAAKPLELKRVYGRTLLGALVLGGAACAVTFPFGGWAIRLVSGAEFGPSAAALYWLAPTLVLVLVSSATTSLLTVLHRPFTILKITTANMVINAALNLYVIPRWGYVGAAATTMVAETFGMIVLLVVAHRHLGRLVESR